MLPNGALILRIAHEVWLWSKNIHTITVLQVIIVTNKINYIRQYASATSNNDRLNLILKNVDEIE